MLFSLFQTSLMERRRILSCDAHLLQYQQILSHNPDHDMKYTTYRGAWNAQPKLNHHACSERAHNPWSLAGSNRDRHWSSGRGGQGSQKEAVCTSHKGDKQMAHKPYGIREIPASLVTHPSHTSHKTPLSTLSRKNCFLFCFF